jgi:hypothetical protein
MLTGVLLGIIMTLLVLACVYMAAVCKTTKSQLKSVNEELFSTRTMLGRFVSIEQERQKIKESININFTEEQITLLASRIGTRVQTIINAAQDAALGKLS